MQTMRQKLISYAKRTYGAVPDRPFSTAPTYEVLRHPETGKWFALFMDVPRGRLGLAGDDTVDIINLKCDPILAGSLRDGAGILRGYHMKRDSWISVLLDGTVAYWDILPLMDVSFQLTLGGKAARVRGRRADWLVPANPAYYDIDEGLHESGNETIYWKQSTDVHVGDAVYIYVAAPVSAIRYRFEAVEVNIPRSYEDENVRMRKMMRLKLVRRYDGVVLGRALMEKHGVRAVRGPRSMPASLAREIGELYGAETEK